MIQVLVALVVLAVVFALAARWVKTRSKLDLSSVLDVKWWLWPLNRLAIHLFWKREVHKDLYKACGWATKEGQPTRGPWRYIFIRRYKGRYWVKIRVRRGFDQSDAIVEGRKSAKQTVVTQARGTLDLGEVDAVWHFRLWRSNVQLTPRKVIPHEAPYADEDVAAAVVAHSSDEKVVLAIGKGDVPVVHSLDHDAPHILVSGSTMGGGKSATLRLIAVQQYWHGAHVLICDPIKKFSHAGWAIDPDTGQPWPRIRYADTIDETAAFLLDAHREFEWRNEKVRNAKRQGRELPVFPRLLILMDDMNGLMSELKRNKHDEALHVLSILLWAGREVWICIAAAFQYATAIAAGGGSNREVFGLRMVCEYQGSANGSNIIAPQVKLPPCIPHRDQPGWAVFVYGATCFEAQRILMTEDEARVLVASPAQPAIDTTATEERTENQSGVPAEAGFPRRRNPSLTDGSVPAATHSLSRSGFSVRETPSLSMQEIEGGIAIDRNDGGIEYSTLREIAERPWCQYKTDTLERYSRAPLKRRVRFPDPTIPQAGRAPARWSERQMRDWCESRARDTQEGYQPLVYFIVPGGRAALRYGAIVKIGKTINLERRLDEFAAHEDDVVDRNLCNTEADMDEMEKDLHQLYDEYRVYPDREWFRVEGRLAERLGVVVPA